MKGRDEQAFQRKKAEIMEACFNCYAENGLTGTGIQALANGDSFESQMRLYSYDTGVTPEDAGYLLHAGSVLWDATFLEAALALEHPGDVFEPVLTSAGVHIILYAGDEPAGPLALTQDKQDYAAAGCAGRQANTGAGSVGEPASHQLRD